MLGDLEHGFELLKLLNGKKHFIIGNHDTKNRIAKYEELTEFPILYADVIKYKKKNSLLYTEIYKNLENFSFAFIDVIYGKIDDIHIFKYLKDNPKDDILENIVKYAVVNDINEKEKIYENNQINSVPLKWLFYTSIKNK